MRIRSWIAMGLCIVGAARPLVAATPEEVDAAIRRGVDFLYSREGDNAWEGSPSASPSADAWSTGGGQWGGVSSLATYALLAAGENAQNPKLMKALNFLRNADIKGHYALGVRANIWPLVAGTPENKKAALRDAELLYKGVAREGRGKGLYNYLPPSGTGIDLSCSQYGVLGAWASSQDQSVFPAEYWAMADVAWRAEQDPETGGWSYNGLAAKDVTVQITAAGVASLFIIQEFVNGSAGADGTKGNIADPAIDRGLACLSKLFPDMIKAASYERRNYALYGIERVGVASGLKYFGRLDWYDVGADFLIKSQQEDGSWTDVIDTSFAVLFLSRGRAPILANKLAYDQTIPPNPATKEKLGQHKEANWNQRPRDLAYTARWVGQTMERTLNWQVTNLSISTVRDLHDSPIAYLTGNQPLALSTSDKLKLKEYIEGGGLLVCNADGANKAFGQSVRELAQELFPKYQMQPLSPEHPLMKDEAYRSSKWARQPKVEALSNGSRLLVVLIPDNDFSRDMQTRNFKTRIEVGQFWANLHFYSVGKDKPRIRGTVHTVDPNPAIQTTRRARIARLDWGGNWDPEPGGWRRLAAILRNENLVDLQPIQVVLGTDSLAGFSIAHLTATDAFSLTDAQRTALKEYLTNGGTLIIDVCGGRSAADEAIHTEVGKMFGEEVVQIDRVIPLDSPLLKVANRKPIEPKIRDYAHLYADIRDDRILLRQLKVNGKPGIIYSPQDLSTGLVGNDVDGIVGYTPATSTEIMRRLVLNLGITP